LLLATVNNEARELNDYRVDTFRLRDYFKAFFSSCYVGLRKPAPQIYKLALGVLQRDAASVAFVDDRSGNVEAAKAVGIHGIVYQGAEQLRLEFERLGIFPGVTA
jgi:putative hydrolase of the HAD superfamily